MRDTNAAQSQDFAQEQTRENIIKKYGFLKAKIILNNLLWRLTCLYNINLPHLLP